MNKISFLFLLFLAVTVLVISTGCRNHIKDFDSTMTDYERNVIREVNIAQVLERNEDNARLRFKLSSNKESEVKVFEIHNTSSRFTPYQAWRELYEVPVGIIVLPVGLVSHIINVVSFGIFPYQWCWNMDCYGLASLNPFMNVESSERFEDEPLRSRRDLVDTRQENRDTILFHSDVMFKLGDKKVHKLTDSTGIVDFDLIDINGNGLVFDTNDRELKVYANKNVHSSYSWVIPRPLKKRLKQARELIKNYEKKQTPENLYKTVIQLSELKFSRLSYFLEKRELKKHGKDFVKKFSMLDK